MPEQILVKRHPRRVNCLSTSQAPTINIPTVPVAEEVPKDEVDLRKETRPEDEDA